MVKVGVQTKGILPEMGIEDGVAIIALAGFEMVDFNLDTFLKNSDVYGGKINKFLMLILKIFLRTLASIRRCLINMELSRHRCMLLILCMCWDVMI